MVFLGMRHAVDVDHVTAIDNLVRMNNANKDARWIGTAFSAGHMSAVLFEMVAIIFFVGTLAGTGGVRRLKFWGGIVGATPLAVIGFTKITGIRNWGRPGPLYWPGRY